MKILIAKKKQRPLDAYDRFERADGALGFSQDIYGYQWLANAAWRVKNGKAICTPNLGGELLNGSFDVNTSGWTISFGTGAISAGGAKNNCLKLSNSGANQARCVDQKIFGANRILQLDFYHKNNLTTGNVRVGATNFGTEYLYLQNVSDDLWRRRVATPIITAANPYIGLRCQSSVLGDDTLYDEVSEREVNFTDTLALLDMEQTSVHIEAKMTLGSMGVAGVAACMDSQTNPQNGILCFHNGAPFGSESGYNTLQMWKLLNGEFTQLLSVAAPYASGAGLILRVINNGATVTAQAYYAGAKVGAEKSISDAPIVNNTLHGLFSTREENLFSYAGVTKL